MASDTVSKFPGDWTVADVLHQLGDVPAHRILAVPPPGTATEADLTAAAARTDRTCELIDGVLVEKPLGYLESMVAMILVRALGDFVDAHQLGIVLGPDGPLRIAPGQVRVPDVSFVAWRHFPNRVLPSYPVLAVAPDLAVEILSQGNSAREMERKLDDYFLAGVRLVWYVDLKSRRVEVYTARHQQIVVDESGHLEGFDLLPGLRIAVADLLVQVP